jgi:tetratricopeptide (TPR) repeat protein
MAVALAAACDRVDSVHLEGLQATQSARGEDEKSPDELKRDIARFKAEVDRTVRAAEDLGAYYRMLAVAYLNRQMYGEALDALESAIRYYPQNEQLYYYAGLAAGHLAKATVVEAERTRLFDLAEKYYNRTLYLYADHQLALFGLAVVYSMEVDRPAEAVPLLERLLVRDTSNVPAKLLLARTQASLGNIDAAIALYGEIARVSSVDDETRAQVLENIRQLEGAPAR